MKREVIPERKLDQLVGDFYENPNTEYSEKILKILAESLFIGPEDSVVLTPVQSTLQHYDKLDRKWKETIRLGQEIALESYRVAKPRKLLGRNYHVHPHLVAQLVASVLDYSTLNSLEVSILMQTALLHDAVEETVATELKNQKRIIATEIPESLLNSGVFTDGDYDLFKEFSEKGKKEGIHIVTDRSNELRYQSYKSGFSSRIGGGELELQRYFGLVDTYVDRLQQEMEEVESNLITEGLDRLGENLERGLLDIQGLSRMERRMLQEVIIDTVANLTRFGSQNYYEAMKSIFDRGVDSNIAGYFAEIVKGCDNLANLYDLDRREKSYLPNMFTFEFSDEQAGLVDAFIDQVNQEWNPERIRAERDKLNTLADHVLMEVEYNLTPLLNLTNQSANSIAGKALESAVNRAAKKNRESVYEGENEEVMLPIERLYKVAKGHIYLANLGKLYENKKMPSVLKKVRELLVEATQQIAYGVMVEEASLRLHKSGFNFRSLRSIWKDFSSYVSEGGLDKITETGESGYDVFQKMDLRVRGNKGSLETSFNSPLEIMKAALGLNAMSRLRYKTNSNFYLPGIGQKGIMPEGVIKI